MHVLWFTCKLEFFYFAPPRRSQTIYYNNDFDCLQRSSSKTCFRALLVCWRLISSTMFSSLNVTIGSFKNTFSLTERSITFVLLVPTLWNWYFIPFNAVKKHRMPTSVKASDVQHACNFAQGKACFHFLQWSHCRVVILSCQFWGPRINPKLACRP